jgi:hypothetical protein
MSEMPRPSALNQRPVPTWATLALGLPATIGAAVAALWLSGAALGVPPGADGRRLTLPEAMAVASHADVARLLRAGADPNGRTIVRGSLVRNQGRPMTPLEAATGAVRTGPLKMLVDAGAIIDEQTYPVLWCAASARGNRDMLDLLRSRDSQRTPPANCSAAQPLW